MSQLISEIPPYQGVHGASSVRSLSSDLRGILTAADGRTLTLAELEELLQGRGFMLFVILLSLPFLFPIAVPGLSIPFGIVIMQLGYRVAVGQKPSLPQFVSGRQLKHATLEKMVGFGLKLCAHMERVVRPRVQFLHGWSGITKLVGLGIASGGFQLCLPLPPLIPFSNFIPALSVVLLTAGLSERDGLLVLAGWFVNIAAWIYFFVMFALAKDGMNWLLHLHLA